ncbi:MAG: ribosome small subunit-dependent GTPase A [Peptoniphilus harei]|nr:ribosome small subunit-dependent GTPase A [Peptoniphilus harei]
MIGKIIKLTGGFYYIKSGDKVFESRARGNFRHTKVEPIVGDDVEFKYEEKTLGYIEKVYPRKNMLTRPKVSNVDLALIVIPVLDPKYNLVIIDKTIIQAEYQGIDLAIIINKSDLDRSSAEELTKIYKNSGFKTFMVSNEDDNIEDLRDYLHGKTVALCGVSGAGKSTITSRILNKEVEVGRVSEKTKRGKHTTRHTEILYNDDIYIFDTPGFSSLSLKIEADDLKNYFREFKKFNNCKFNNCNHIKEPKCAVKDAVDRGEIEKSRYENYLYIYNELKEKGEY